MASSTFCSPQTLLGKEDGLMELASLEGWSREEVEGEEVTNKKLLAKVRLLKDVWRTREPKVYNSFASEIRLK